MAPVKVNDLIILPDSRTIYKVTFIDFIRGTVTLLPLQGQFTKFGQFTVQLTAIKNCQVLGNINLDPILKLLYE